MKTFIAKLCYMTQLHLDGRVPEYMDETSKLQCIEQASFQVSCLLAENTKDGRQGVESDIVVDELEDSLHTPLTIIQWERIIDQKAIEHGDWLNA